MRHLIYTVFAVAFLAALFVAPIASGQDAGRELSPAEARREARLFDRHVVRMGETAFSIARGYAISPITLAEDNPGLDLTQLRTGQVLLVRKRERGKTNHEQIARQWQELADIAAADDSRVGGESGADESSPQDVFSPDSLWNALSDRDRAGIRLGQERGRWLDGERNFAGGGSPHIALMLPLTGTSANPAGNDFTDFYKGGLLALENLKSRGRSATLNVYGTGRSVEKVQAAVSSADFMETDLIIGPVYEQEMEPAVRFGEYFGVPVVSPLAAVRNLQSNVLYQMAPDAGSKYDKLRPLLEGDVNIVMVSSGTGDDAEFEREMATLLDGRSYSRYIVGGDEEEVAPFIDWERENVLVVLAGTEGAVDRALATISSSYSNALARRARRADITVIGSSRWANYGAAIDRNLFFKLGVKFVANYYIDRSNRETRAFEARYLEVYGDFPSRAAFRGYDTVSLFAGALFENGFSFDDRLERVGATPLGTTYRFVRAENSGEFGNDERGDFGNRNERGETRVNDQWTLVSFTPGYNIITQ